MSDECVGYLRDVNDGENIFEVFEGKLTIGRQEANNVRIDSKSVSKFHAEIEVDLGARPPRIMLHDLGSTNATFVNEVRVMGTSKALKWGDVLRFGYDKAAYRIIKFEDLQSPEPREAEAAPIPAHQRPAAGITSQVGHVADRDLADGSVIDRSFNSPAKDRPRTGQRAGSPSERRAQFDGIGYQQEDPAKAARREQEERDRQRAEEEAEQEARDREMRARAANAAAVERRPSSEVIRFDDQPRPSTGGGVRPGTGYAPGLPPPDGNRRDLDELMAEEERRLADELAKKKRDLGMDGRELDEEEQASAEHIQELQKQVQALVIEMSAMERQLAFVRGDDLARCLLDAQQSLSHVKAMLKAKEEEVERLRGQQRQLSAGGTEQWHSILENTNAKCRLLERENSEWKARDEKTARRWTELQNQSAAYAARVGELETLLQRQRDAAEEDSIARDTEVRAMNKRMAEIASAADPSKLEAARFLVDQVSEQEKAMRMQKEHTMQLEARMLELKRENEYMRQTLTGLGADQGGEWQGEALRRLQDQVDELRAQGGVQAVLEAHDKAQQYYADLQAKDKELAVYREKSLKTDAVQMHDRDASALREQLKAKDDRILQLEEVKMKLEDERGAMDRKLEELERRDAISKAAVQTAQYQAVSSGAGPAAAAGFVARAPPGGLD